MKIDTNLLGWLKLRRVEMLFVLTRSPSYTRNPSRDSPCVTDTVSVVSAIPRRLRGWIQDRLGR